jgi:hypothetical protein
VEIADQFCLANRWSALPEFLHYIQDKDFVVDRETAVVIDLDKTAIGARGRNDLVIDQARMEGVENTVADLLGRHFDKTAFRTAYEELNRPAYHTFTLDNQDYLAYICLMLGAGLFELEELTTQIARKELSNVRDLFKRLQSRTDEIAAAGLLPIHREVWQLVQKGNPTPFKAFRLNEYLTTSARFGELRAGTVDEILSQRIVITQEVRQAAIELARRDALIFGLSDKPDEASLPDEKQRRAGLKPLHRLKTLAVGEDRM